MSQISISIDATVSLNTGVNSRTLEPFVYLSISATKGFLDLSWTVEKSSRHALMNLLNNQQSITLPLLCSLESVPGNDGEIIEYVVCEYIVDDVSLVFTPRDKSTKRTLLAMLNKYRDELYNKISGNVAETSPAPNPATTPASTTISDKKKDK